MLHTGLIASVSDLLERHRKERPDKVAYWDAVRSATYSQLAGRTARMAAGLAEQGVRDGDRIAIFLPNGVDWIEACFGGLRAGAVIVPISYDAAEAEIAYRLLDADCRTVITTSARKELITRLVKGAGGPVLMVLAGAGAKEAGLSLEQLAQNKTERRARSRRHRPFVVHHLYVGHDGPGQRRAFVDPRNAVDRRFVLGADLRSERKRCHPVATAVVSFVRSQSLGVGCAGGGRQRTHPGKIFTAAGSGFAAIR